MLDAGVDQKIMSAVSAPDSLDLFDCHYELSGFIMHSGRSLREGHYICYGKRPSSDTDANHRKKWYCFNDSTVTCCTQHQIDLILAGDKDSKFQLYQLMYEVVTEEQMMEKEETMEVESMEEETHSEEQLK